ncbi:MerR family DNA-binding transcriptional regulator [Streptomyces sp. C184]|uniref:MerR family DNA-binding transcriptional regulator n=1 Tax=Streptomyces sp. C184 TaxID=3237121 RepID=UPI0034C615D5
MSTLKSSALRTVDVARRAGYSVQQVRNLERDGVLPPATRTAAGYRRYGELHVHSALARGSFAPFMSVRPRRYSPSSTRHTPASTGSVRTSPSPRRPPRRSPPSRSATYAPRMR